jgi:bifunctional DNA-binding transcriptional regulator/antitoxin component of YhaV-PrlF toxin-antitoxin module
MKYKIWIIIGCLALIFIMASISVYAIKEMPLETKEMSFELNEISEEVIEMEGERIVIEKYGDHHTIIRSFHEISDYKSFEAYRTRNIERLSMLSENEEVDAVVTFEKLLSEEEVKRALGNELKSIQVKIKSYPEGTGQISFPHTPEDREEHEMMEKVIGKNIEEFRLIDGYVSANICGTKHELQMISENPLVFDVNLGPVELKKEYPDAIFYFGDISYNVEKYRGYQ